MSRFVPHVAKTSTSEEPLVWAIDTRHSPHFWFPRDCPRGCAWLTETTTEEDRVRFLGHSSARRLHVIEAAWAEPMTACTLYAYRLPIDTFESVHDAGYWISQEPVEALERVAVGNLIERHAEAGIELRITPDIWPFWHSVIFSTQRQPPSQRHPSRTTATAPPVGRPDLTVRTGRVPRTSPAGRCSGCATTRAESAPTVH